MKTILLPTDFSPSSKNSATYAIELAKAWDFEKIILYNAYQAPVITEPTMPTVQVLDYDALSDISNAGLEQFKSSIQHLSNDVVEIECMSEFGILDSSITEVCERTGSEIIVMGISGGSNFEEVLIGSTATSVASHTKIPVIIVPPQAVFSPIEEIVLACSFKKVAETTPVSEIKKLLNVSRARLFIVYVNENRKTLDNDFEVQKQKVEEMFGEYNPEYHIVENDDYVVAINDFAVKHSADLIVTIPKKHGFLSHLFKRSHTKHLAFHTNVPLMCIHGEGL